ncbi:hypothetical protein FUSO8_02875 [Fusobacterium necrophorum DJ-2]|nr:hypothetical protein FUSO8_02875 [Fusobacterium necrophorum DJ-2]
MMKKEEVLGKIGSFCSLTKKRRNGNICIIGNTKRRDRMITKTIKMEEKLIQDILEISKIYNMSFSDFVRKALKKEIEEKKNDFFYKMKTVAYATKEETEDILEGLNSLAKEDLEYVEEEEIAL